MLTALPLMLRRVERNEGQLGTRRARIASSPPLPLPSLRSRTPAAALLSQGMKNSPSIQIVPNPIQREPHPIHQTTHDLQPRSRLCLQLMLMHDLFHERSSERIDEESYVQPWVEKEKVACNGGERTSMALEKKGNVRGETGR